MGRIERDQGNQNASRRLTPRIRAGLPNTRWAEPNMEEA
jgi:hypothetical protein